MLFKPKDWKPPLPLGARGPPPNTPIPPPTNLSSPNDSVVSSCTSTQLCNKVPIGFNGTPQIQPQNCPFPFNDQHSHLIHPSLYQPHSPSQMASGSNQLFCHSTFSAEHFLDRQTDTQTDRWETTARFHDRLYLQY